MPITCFIIIREDSLFKCRGGYFLKYLFGKFSGSFFLENVGGKPFSEEILTRGRKLCHDKIHKNHLELYKTILRLYIFIGGQTSFVVI